MHVWLVCVCAYMFVCRNDFVQILSFVRNVAGQTSEEKIDFFRFVKLIFMKTDVK